MDTVLLRKLSFKSIIGFGKYAEKTVQQIIDTQDFNYLFFLYYQAHGISFTDDVLEFLHISPEYQIQKPGRDIKMMNNFRYQIVKLTTEEKNKIKSLQKLKKKIRYKVYKNTNRMFYNASRLQRINQGHKTI